MGALDQLKKQGGMKLIKQYASAGVLGTAIGQFLLLGKSRTALEILRLSTNLKVKRKLEKKYKSTLLNFDKQYDDSLDHNTSEYVWICWFQGMNNAPEIVKKCYESVKRNMPDKKIVVITSDNISDYIEFPDYILEKWKAGYITHTHMTDLLRLELLIKYGGLWLDATVFVSDSNIEDYYSKSDLFFFQNLKPGRDGDCTYISSWLIGAKTNNKILLATRELCYEYWKKNTKMVDYFLLHDFMAIVLDYYEEDWKKVVPRDNATPHILLLRLFDEYDEDMWNAIKEQTHFHKLSYKNNRKDIANTYCDIVLNYDRKLQKSN